MDHIIKSASRVFAIMMAGIVGLAAGLFPAAASAQTVPIPAPTLASLEAQLDDLAAQLRVLQASLRNGTSVATPAVTMTTAATAPSAAFTPGLPNTGIVEGTGASIFYRNLTLGDRGPDVLALEQFLNQNGFTIVASGPGSPGNETDFFGMRTRLALIRWQKANGIYPSNGVFGPASRALVESTSVGTNAVGLPATPSTNLATSTTATSSTATTTTSTVTNPPSSTMPSVSNPSSYVAPPVQTSAAPPPSSLSSSPYPPSPSAAMASPNSSH